MKIDKEKNARFNLYVLPTSDTSEVSKIADKILYYRMNYSLIILTTAQDGPKAISTNPFEQVKQSEIEKIINSSAEKEPLFGSRGEFEYDVWRGKSVDSYSEMIYPSLKDNANKEILFGFNQILEYLRLLSSSERVARGLLRGLYSLDKD